MRALSYSGSYWISHHSRRRQRLFLCEFWYIPHACSMFNCIHEHNVIHAIVLIHIQYILLWIMKYYQCQHYIRKLVFIQFSGAQKRQVNHALNRFERHFIAHRWILEPLFLTQFRHISFTNNIWMAVFHHPRSWSYFYQNIADRIGRGHYYWWVTIIWLWLCNLVTRLAAM